MSTVGVGEVAVIFVAIVAIAALFVWLFRAMWHWVVPAILPKAVGEGLVAPSVSWGTSVRVLLVLVLALGRVGELREGMAPHTYVMVLSYAVTTFVLAVLLTKWMWPKAIPSMFPGGVDQGLVARTISWYTALKVALVLVLVRGTALLGTLHYSRQ